MPTPWLIAISLAVIIIAALAFYAGKLLRQLKQQTQRQQEAGNGADKRPGARVYEVIVVIRSMICAHFIPHPFLQFMPDMPGMTTSENTTSNRLASLPSSLNAS